MRKKRLMTPGPTQVPEESLLSLARQVTHHRTDDFTALFRRTTDDLRRVFRTEGDIFLLAGSGTAAMDAAVGNVVGEGERALVLTSGKFSERWAEIVQSYHGQVERYDVPWGEVFDPEEIARRLKNRPETVAVFGTLCETSTGVVHPIEKMGRAIREHSEALFVLDGISGVGADRLETDAWGVDLLAVGSQKALMGLPGAAILSVGRRGWKKIESTRRTGFYFDLLKYRKSAAEATTPFTPPKSVLEALELSVHLLLSEGMENLWRRIERQARAVRSGVEALGLRRTTSQASNAMTCAFFPQNIDGKRFLNIMEERFGVKFAGGQGIWKGKIFRMAHFGLIDEFDILGTLSTMEMALAECGFSVEFGRAAAAAEAVLFEK